MAEFSEHDEIIQKIESLKNKISSYQSACDQKLHDSECKLKSSLQENEALRRENSNLKEKMCSWQRRIASSIGMIKTDK